MIFLLYGREGLLRRRAEHFVLCRVEDLVVV